MKAAISQEMQKLVAPLHALILPDDRWRQCSLKYAGSHFRREKRGVAPTLSGSMQTPAAPAGKVPDVDVLRESVHSMPVIHSHATTWATLSAALTPRKQDATQTNSKGVGSEGCHVV
jgi:hypothetical protein